MTTHMLWVWLLAACSAHSAPIQVARRNLRQSAQLNLIIANRSIGDDVACGTTVLVSAESDMNQRCPSSCPLYAEDHQNSGGCAFACVGNSIASCKSMNPMTPVPDLKRGECRGCEVNGCDVCRDDGTERCATCLTGYLVDRFGKCTFTGPWLIAHWCLYLLLIVVAVVFAFVIWWIVDLSFRSDATEDAQEILDFALQQRSRAKIHMPKEVGKPRTLWPLSTNLCKANVAGPAVKLHFNFQVAVIIWALVLALVWGCLGTFVDSDMMILGTRGAETARQSCINVKWGHHTMHKTMWAKIGFLFFAYIFSFLGAILFGIRQWRLYEADAVEISTHKNFAAILHGLPELPGTEKVEDDLQAAVMTSIQERPIGVSVGWQVEDSHIEILHSTLDNRIQQLRSKRRAFVLDHEDTMIGATTSFREPNPTTWRRIVIELRKVFKKIERVFVKPGTQRMLARGREKKNVGKTNRRRTSNEEADEEPEEITEEEVQETLGALKTSSTAIVVFETQQVRDRAVNIWKEVPMEFPPGNILRVESPNYEPSAILWQNMSNETMKQQCQRFCGVSVFVVMMIGLLCAFEYGYYHVQLGIVFASGEETVFSLSFIFSTIGVAITMSVLCICSAEVAERCKFQRVGSRETCFVILYTFSVLLQVTLDLVIAYHIGKHLMDVNNIHTYEGKRIGDMSIFNVHEFVDVFEAYAMQKQLGATILSFGFPCAFLLPFLFEPLISIFLPYKLMSLIIRSHREIKPRHAEGYLEAVPMDLGRYGDILINVVVGSLIVWFPGGFTYTIFIFLACSHVYIYCFDHYRVLRCVESIYISSFTADWVAQHIFAIPCALIAAALVFKSNCESESMIAPYVFPTTQLYRFGLWGSACDEGWPLIFKVCLTFLCHLLLHSFAMNSFVPLFGYAFSPAETEEVKKIPYRETAERYPCSWFSANLVHCLRSEYVYQYDPPFDYCVSGKEHLMRLNEDIGAFFHDQKASAEEYNDQKNLEAIFSQSMDMSEVIGTEAQRKITKWKKEFEEGLESARSQG